MIIDDPEGSGIDEIKDARRYSGAEYTAVLSFLVAFDQFPSFIRDRRVIYVQNQQGDSLAKHIPIYRLRMKTLVKWSIVNQ